MKEKYERRSAEVKTYLMGMFKKEYAFLVDEDRKNKKNIGFLASTQKATLGMLF